MDWGKLLATVGGGFIALSGTVKGGGLGGRPISLAHGLTSDDSRTI